MPENSKSELRKALRKRRRSLPSDTQQHAQQAVAQLVHTLPCWNQARYIALYQSTDGEINPATIALNCRAENKQVFLPVIHKGKRLTFARWNEHDELVKNPFGIPEPPPQSATIDTSMLDIILVPLVGWDKKGCRLGMGGGYYDRALASISGPVVIGLAYEVQEVADIPTESWDVPLDAIVTDTLVHHFPRK